MLLCAMIALGVTSCRKRSINGDLDGQWQVMEIEYADGTVENPEGVYYCLFLHTVNLTRIGGVVCAGNMIYEGDKLSLEFPYATPEQLKTWGIDSKETTFTILHLSGSRMTLRSGYSLIQLRKF